MKVSLIDYMGSDLSVCRAARVSFSKTTEYELALDSNKVLQKVLREGDQKLIKFLAKHKHVLPFRHPHISVHIKVPMFVARQLGKHQVGMSWSEESRRYIDKDPEFYCPDIWRSRAKDKKQGSSDEPIIGVSIVFREFNSSIEHALDTYKNMLGRGVAPEQARMILPQNTYIEAIWTGSLLAFFHVWNLRSKSDAQKEVQEVAKQIDEIISPLYPHSWAALKEFS